MDIKRLWNDLLSWWGDAHASRNLIARRDAEWTRAFALAMDGELAEAGLVVPMHPEAVKECIDKLVAYVHGDVLPYKPKDMVADFEFPEGPVA